VEGRLDLAGALATEAVRLSTEAKFGVAVGWAQQALARVAVARGLVTEAIALLDQALATFTETGSRYELARTHLELASIVWGSGDRAAAYRHLAAAHGLFKELDVPRYVERAERLAAGWTEQSGPRIA
jgi:hypothetical protein